jgi:hypothetical protein
MTNPQQAPYLPVQRNFPQKDPTKLGPVLDKMYVEVASRLNERTIGLFAPGSAIVTGEKYYLNKQTKDSQSMRQTYETTNTNPLPHNINLSQLSYFSRMYGQYSNATFTNWYGLIPASTIAIAGQISFYLDQTNIVFVSGAGAPTMGKAIIVLEYISSV